MNSDMLAFPGSLSSDSTKTYKVTVRLRHEQMNKETGAFTFTFKGEPIEVRYDIVAFYVQDLSLPFCEFVRIKELSSLQIDFNHS